jgi:hypothetical protein
LIPYQLTARIKGVFPTKFFEYLAAGLPVLATPLPDLLPFEGPLLRLWPGAAAQPFEQPTAALRKAAQELAAANSWAQRFEQLMAQL